MAETKQIAIEQRFLKDFMQKLILAKVVMRDIENQIKIEAGLVPVREKLLPVKNVPVEKKMDNDAIRRYLQSRNPQLNQRFSPQPLSKPVAKPNSPVISVERKPIVTQTAVGQQTNVPVGVSSYEKVISFLKDPTIISIESPGPEKPLLVNRSGSIQTTNMILTKEDIDEIVREVSKKTKIPILRGVFKAAFGEYLITAVISEYVGTRFTIQKKPVFNN